MARLAEYMADLAEILGHQKSVHFVELRKGSAVVVGRVDSSAVASVTARTNDVRRGIGAERAIEAFNRVNARLRDDKTNGELRGLGRVIKFPGYDDVEEFGAFTQDEVMDGVVIRLGGTGTHQPVNIQVGDCLYPNCFARADLIQQLGHFIQSEELRFHGRARWWRSPEGEWKLKRFTIDTFSRLDQAPLREVVDELRQVPNHGFDSSESPWDELDSIRRGER